jgi:hypothetical protein
LMRGWRTLALMSKQENPALDPRRTTALQAALQFVMTSSSVPADHKATLISALLQALQGDETAELQRQTSYEAREWQTHEIALLETFLKDRVARNWQEADEAVMHLATQLQRDPRSIRDKATQLGLGTSVDYWLSKALKRPHEE